MLSQDGFLFSVSIISGSVCIVLAVIKFMLGKVLTSRALITDGRCTHRNLHRWLVFEQFVRMILFLMEIYT